MNGLGKMQGVRSMYPRQREQGISLEPVKGSHAWPILGLAVLILSTIAAIGRPSPRQRTLPVTPVLPNHVPERILVKAKAHVNEAQLQSLFRSHRVLEVDSIHQIDVRVLRVPEARLEAVLAALQAEPGIEFAEPDVVLEPDLVPNDTYYASEWHLQKIQAPQAWDISVGSNFITIAVLDTGIDAAHPDLASKVVPGWNFYDNNSNTSDPIGHGTAVAGVATAITENGFGVASVAWNCLLMPIRITDTNGNAALSTIATALNWAADHGALVANVSYTASWSSTVQTAAQYFMSKGGVVVMSSGNDGQTYNWPDTPYIVTVGATDTNDVVTTWSTKGTNLDLTAPGLNILSTALAGRYGNASGTSFASPIVAGVAALVLSANPNLSASQVRTLLETTADDLGPPGWDPSYGHGRVNAYKAVLAATGGTSNNTGPTVTLMTPSSGSTLSNTVAINVNVSDTLAITSVSCVLNGVSVSTNTTVPALFSWATTNYPNGAYTLQAAAYDSAGHSGTSAVVSVTVLNPVPDTISPTVVISSPANFSTVSGSSTVQVSASDNVGVGKIEWYLNSLYMGSSSSSSASFTWNTTTLANGSYTLQAKAYDGSGNVGTSSSVNVTVQNIVADTTPPVVQILSPDAGAILSGINSVNASASDDVGVTRVEWYVDGNLNGSSASANAAFSWDTSKMANGTHILLAKAYDAGGNVGASADVSVTVQNTVISTTPPAVQITSPSTSSSITQKSTKVYVTSSDAVGVTRADLIVDGKFYSSQTVSPAALNWNPVFSWNTTKLSKGSHTLQSVAYDAAGNTSRSTVVTVTK